VTECGALARIERQVEQHHARALQAIAVVGGPARSALTQLAGRALFRDA